MLKRDIQYAIVNVILFLLSLFTDWYRPLVFGVTIVMIYFTLEKMGRAIILRELISLHLVFICLFMPLMGYIYFNQNDFLARKWMRYMFIPEEEYFQFALPASIGFITTLCWPLTDKAFNDFASGLMPVIERAKVQIEKFPYSGTILLVTGLVMFTLSAYLPVELQFAFQLFYFASFTGFLYVYNQRNLKYRFWIIAGFIFYILAQTLDSAMFTIIAYMGITLFSFLFLNKYISIYKKLIAFFAGVTLLFFIQSVKIDYRKYVWNMQYEGSKASLFFELLENKLRTFDDIDAKTMYFPIYYRTNQGFNVALVMKRIPKVVEHDNGRQLGLVFASAFIPRFLWPNKPEAGGRENMQYYAGVSIRGYSTNVGLLGEAYGAFGLYGGIFYMIFLGLLVRFCYRLVFKLALKLPILIFWVPVLFFQTSYCSETDTLQIINSLFKSALFIWMLYWIFPQLFGRTVKREKVNPETLTQG